MLLDRLFHNLAVRVEPFAVCEVAPDWHLRLDALGWVTFHFVLQGEGGLNVMGHPRLELAPSTLAVVPPGLGHVIEGRGSTGREASTRAATPSRTLDPAGLPRYVAGPPEREELLIACGRVQVIYGDGIELFDGLAEPLALDFSDSPEMQRIFTRLLEETRQASPTSAAMMGSLMNECLVLVFRALCDRPDCRLPWLTALDDPRLAAALTAILESPDDPHTVASLAERAAMSRSAFARDFGRSFGRPPMRYVREVRLRRAADLLLTTDLTVEAIARRVGMPSRSQFTRAFGNHFGRAPDAYRRGEGGMTMPSDGLPMQPS